IDVEYGASTRVIHLLQGRVHLDVAPDPHRPLQVTTRQGTVTALRTVYTVASGQAETNVLVAESQVEVCPNRGLVAETAHLGCVQVGAGEATEVRAGHVTAAHTIDSGLRLDWQSHRLVVDNQPLVK